MCVNRNVHVFCNIYMCLDINVYVFCNIIVRYFILYFDKRGWDKILQPNVNLRNLIYDFHVFFKNCLLELNLNDMLTCVLYILEATQATNDLSGCVFFVIFEKVLSECLIYTICK